MASKELPRGPRRGSTNVAPPGTPASGSFSLTPRRSAIARAGTGGQTASAATDAAVVMG
jgi:hypothetical protein